MPRISFYDGILHFRGAGLSRHSAALMGKIAAPGTGGCDMQDVLRTNDPVLLSFAGSVLEEAGIAVFVADQFTAGIEGSIGAFPRRISVPDDEVGRARTALTDAGLAAHLLDPRQ